MALELFRIFLCLAHVLAASVWLGAMGYSLLVLHPRARAFFQTPSRFEEFITFTAAGARWKVLAGCSVIGLTGLGLLFFHEPASAYWRTCMGIKAGLFSVALGIFAYTSWVAWPARVMAGRAEIASFQRRFKVIGLSLVSLVVLCYACSYLARLKIG